VKLGALPVAELTTRLARGLDVDTGPFVVRVETEIPALAEELRLLYGDFPVDAGGGLADFHVSVRRPAGPLGLRRWWRQQAMAYLDDARPFEPLPIIMAVPMLEWSINWCAATRANQYVMIHAAVLERDGRALVLPGVTGAGKSTLCASLSLRDWRLLSDEFALIRPDHLHDRGRLAVPGMRRRLLPAGRARTGRRLHPVPAGRALRITVDVWERAHIAVHAVHQRHLARR